MRRRFLLFALMLCAVSSAMPQQPTVTRDQTREMLRATLDKYGPNPAVSIEFRQSDKNPYNFVGVMKTGLKNAELLEVVIGVSNDQTIGFRIYPKVKGNYLNINRAHDSAGLMKQLLFLSNHNFLFWGADDSGDAFAGYTITLESGYPEKAVQTVLWSTRKTDDYIGELTRYLDAAPSVP